MKKSIILLALGLIATSACAQNVQVVTKKTKSGCFIKGVKPRAYIRTHADTSTLQDTNALYYEDMDITDSAIAPIVLAKREVVMDIPRECASEYWVDLFGSTIGFYMYKGSISVTTLSAVKFTGMYDFSIYVAEDDAQYNGRVQNGKLLYCFYIHK